MKLPGTVTRFVVAVFSVCATSSLFAGQCGYATGQAGVTTGYSQINYVVANAPVSAVAGALAIWSEGCLGQGTTYPSLTSSSSAVSGAGILNLTVVFQSGTSSTQSCGESFLQYSASSGALVGGTIVIYQYQVKNGIQTPCNSLSNFDALIAHELGHSLGLADQYMIDPNSCLGALMSGDPEYVFSDECQIVEASFQTPAERPQHAGGGVTGPDGCYEIDCNGGTWNPDPLVLDLDGNGIETSGLSDMVWFDLDGNGARDQITWTNADTLEGFLWLNLSEKNRVDNGRELFGIGTILPDGTSAGNGFQALATYDAKAQGGNGDGVVDPDDAVWTQLRVWVDSNHNGICEPTETSPLARFGIEGISLNYVRTTTVDGSGNRHSLKARCWRHVRGRLEFFDVDSLTFQGHHF
jgi:hypothetical protein